LNGCREARYWIDLLHETGYIPDALHADLMADCEELLGMLRGGAGTGGVEGAGRK
jgi:hypothetical protein